VFRALTVLIGGLCRHIRLHVRVVGGDLSFASIFHNHLQQSFAASSSLASSKRSLVGQLHLHSKPDSGEA
jgi:hypothetical protein